MTDSVSEYEAKRLRRIEENRRKLQSLNLPALEALSPSKPKQKKRKRDAEEKPLQPTRKSSRQRKQRKVERQQRQVEKEERKKLDKQEQKNLKKYERKKLKRLKKQKKLEKKLQKELKAAGKKRHDEEQPNKDQPKEQETLRRGEPQPEQQPRILDWRLRRKLQAQAERRKASLERREARKIQRQKEKAKKLRLKLKERRLKKKERVKRLFQNEIERQQRFEELELMKMEDDLARQLKKQHKKEEEQEKTDITCQFMKKILTERQELKRKADKKKEEDRCRDLYPVRQVNLPFVRISDATEIDPKKPLVLSPLLKVDANLFHAFSLGKQFLPPGKKSVMQGLCPGGYTAAFRSDVDIHAWRNAMTLFVNGTTGMFYHYMFEEATLRGRKHIFFRWARCLDVTPSILERLRRVPKGEEHLRFHNNYFDTPNPTDKKPEPLLLFVQYPNGPYIYCGRLGYLGYRSNPLEFSFQLLDINALNWRQLRNLLTDSYNIHPVSLVHQSLTMEGAEPLSEYEAKRRQRMEENRRVLASLSIPTIPRPSPRLQPTKAAGTLEPTRTPRRRSSRQKKRRAIAEQQERERQTRLRHEMERQVARRGRGFGLKKKQAALREEVEVLDRQQQQHLKRKLQQELQAVQKKTSHTVRERELRRQQDLEWRQQELIERYQEMRKQQLKRQEQKKPLSEKIVQRNAEVQNLIQGELDKQAQLAKQKKQRTRRWMDKETPRG
ncbi:hypothetical protein PHYPSEUDO_013296 [Phytophthora pseudosyringae]|uniref:Uncharacterized protein n=1 Tax=Phytophthora pseudosyringae TaxID=221518 RepID=A0A8T1V8R3_9STRA|nr:hypothetical protein PHYPSEUDO_013296 [Phytophthora pseudosyringae]